MNQVAQEYRENTFNYLLTHRAIPQLMFSDLDYFYKTILPSAQNMQIFMQNALREAMDLAKDNPNIETGYTMGKFIMGINSKSERSIIWVDIPRCDDVFDCKEIAFSTKREYAGYFTCNPSVNPIDSELCFTLGEWIPEGQSFRYLNHGIIDIIDTEMSFTDIAADLAYGKQT